MFMYIKMYIKKVTKREKIILLAYYFFFVSWHIQIRNPYLDSWVGQSTNQKGDQGGREADVIQEIHVPRF